MKVYSGSTLSNRFLRNALSIRTQAKLQIESTCCHLTRR